jgi:AcrR family transcriptional regulator
MKSLPAPKNAPEIPTEVKDPGLVDRRRRQIVDAAVALFIRQGFHQTTTRQIAKAAGFSIGTLYEYVSSKQDVLYLVCEAIHQEMEARLRQRLDAAGEGVAALGAAIEVYIQVCDSLADHILLIYQETANLPPESMHFVLANEERVTAIFKELLQRGVADYSLKPLDQGQMELTAHNIAVLGHMWAFRRWSLGKNFSLEQYIGLQRELLMGQLT